MRRLLFLMAPALAGAFSLLPAQDARSYLVSGQNTVNKIYYQTDSDFAKTYAGKMAMDSDPETSWISQLGNGSHWLEIDFGIKRLMSHITVTPGKKDNSRTIRKFSLQFFHQEKWFDFVSVDCEANPNSVYDLNLGGVDASRFRILIPEGGTYKGYAAIAEIEARVGQGKIRYYDARLKKLIYPIKNGFLPEADSGYPNAPRAYRGGRHVGIDIHKYYDDDGTYQPKMVTRSTPILAAGEGTIIRADWDWKTHTPEEWKAQSAYYQKNQHTFDARSFGGRQVWIDHGDGVVTTYNHMSSIDKGITMGAKVKRGQKIGTVGNSGLLGEAEGKDYGIHLHFEIWVDSYYLGYGMDMAEVKNYVRWIFFPTQ
jgi:murein DD-endopeptidase MepM/ murein hydrolase activator NlpD